jgi:choline dehydrogenase-like flavoprotein
MSNPKDELTTRQVEILRAACDTFVPSVVVKDDGDGYWARAASDVRVAEAIAALVADLPPAQRREFRQLLFLLGSPLLGLTWGGPLRPLDRLAPDRREEVFRSWSLHPIPQLRKGFASLKKLTGLLYYGLAGPDSPNPNWAAIGYPGPPAGPARREPAPLNVLCPTGDVTLTCDTVVVGSGAGGGVIAGELAASGDDVIVVEKGPYIGREDFDGLEVPAMRRMYEQMGALVTTDGGVSVLAGSCLGGGTTINWAGAFRTPAYVLEQWATKHDLQDVLGDSLRRSFDEVESALDVGTDRGDHNRQNEALIRGCAALGYSVQNIPRNTHVPKSREEWSSLGFSPFGDLFGVKQGMNETYLQKASDHGARLIARTTVSRVRVQRGRALGLEAVYIGPDGTRRHVIIHARRVVIAAGAIHTPALLARSGLEHPHLGRHLFLHPTVAVAARYSEVIDPWEGPMMSALSDAFSTLDGTYGFRLETPPTHAGILGLALPWQGGQRYKADMLQARHIGSTIVLTRDRDGGRVRTNSQGQPVLEYHLSAYDRDHLLRGIVEATRVHLAAGAEVVHLPHHSAARITAGDDLSAALAALPRWRWKSNTFPLFSAHQMGTCRMGGDSKRHPVAPNGSFRGVRGLYVADGSIFPESSGANPMLSILGLAHHIAQGLKADVTGPGPSPVRTESLPAGATG